MFRAVLVGHEEGEAPRGLRVVASHEDRHVVRDEAFRKLRLSRELSEAERSLPLVIQQQWATGWEDVETIWCKDPHHLAVQTCAFHTPPSMRPRGVTLSAGTLVKLVSQRYDSIKQIQTVFHASTDGGETWYLYTTYSLVPIGARYRHR